VLKYILSLLTIGLVYQGAVASPAAAGKMTLVICSSSSPRAEGFELARVSRKKDKGTGFYTVVSRNWNEGGIRFEGTYDVQLRRLKVKAIQVDEDGEEGQFLASVDGVASAGEHLRMIFMNPVGPEKTFEQVELVCNIVSH